MFYTITEKEKTKKEDFLNQDQYIIFWTTAGTEIGTQTANALEVLNTHLNIEVLRFPNLLIILSVFKLNYILVFWGFITRK